MNILAQKGLVKSILLIAVIIILLIYIFLTLINFSISKTIELYIAGLLGLLTTLISIVIPINIAYRNEEIKSKGEKKRVYIYTASFVGLELKENEIRIRQVLDSNSEILEDLLKNETSENSILDATISIWAAAADDINKSLLIYSYQGFISSGNLVKVDDMELGKLIQTAYGEIFLLQQRLQRLSIFFRNLLNPPKEIKSEYVSNTKKRIVPKTLEAVIADKERVFNAIRNAISAINIRTKPYDIQI